MSWLVDNANSLYILFGIIAAGFVVAWRFNQRVKFLGIAAGVLVLMGFLWLLTQFIVTDAKQLESNVQAMARAVEAGKVDDLFKHVSKDFNYKGMTRALLYEAARKSIETHRVSEIRVTQFSAEVSRANKSAKTTFNVNAWAAGNEQLPPFITQADFVLEGDEWKLKTMRFYRAIVNTNEEIDLPGIR